MKYNSNMKFEDGRVFGDNTFFGSKCMFGDNTVFGKNTRFSIFCEYGDNVSFSDKTYFGVCPKFNGRITYNGNIYFSMMLTYGYCSLPIINSEQPVDIQSESVVTEISYIKAVINSFLERVES